VAPLSKLKIALSLVLTIFLMGTIGFHTIEGWNLVDSFYVTVTTLSTVGYGDFVPRTTPGKLFAVFIIILGVGTMLYSSSRAACAACWGGGRGRG
jgi:voltage-gated potassium channel